MIAGRLHWFASGQKVSGRAALARFEFDNGALTLTEAGSKRRASLHLLQGDAELERIDPGGLDVFAADLAAFSARLTLEHHTLKRALTDPRLFSGIGNAYSDEILHRAHLSPLAMTHKLDQQQIAQLYQATRSTLKDWTERLRATGGAAFPEGVTAFRPGMAVHGRYRQPCPRCGTPVQRIRYADNETNYCPHCQTEDRVLADRALSRLLKDDWPRTVDELDQLGRRPG
jgi:formamidopyrimidine-DNA glycosylase